MLMRVPCQRIEVTLARMVIPRSRSRSLESSARSTRRWLSRTAPDCCSSRSTKVVLPWSTWAMIATLRRFMGCIKNRSRASKGPLLPGNIVSAPRGAMRDQLARFLSLCGPAPLRRGTGKATMVGERGGGRVRSSVPVKNRRRILCVFPHYTPAFGTFNHAYRLMKGVRAFMPPQGLLLIAAYMPERWPVRFIDENIRRANAADFAWADIVVVSGMHVQAPQINNIVERAHAAGKAVVLGGPSASASPEIYPQVDYLHIGEMGDATDRIIALIDQGAARPAQQLRFETKERLPLTDFPIPAYD